MNFYLHFADDPDDTPYGPISNKTLCGGHFKNTTNWDAASVTCERCLEVMEERAAGVKAVRADEIIVGSSTAFISDLWVKDLEYALEQQRQLAEILARVKKKHS